MKTLRMLLVVGLLLAVSGSAMAIGLVYEEGPNVGQPFPGGGIHLKIQSYDVGSLYPNPFPGPGVGYSGLPAPFDAGGEAAGVVALDLMPHIPCTGAQSNGTYPGAAGIPFEEDTWAIFRVTEIDDAVTLARIWSPAGKGYELSGVVYGEQDIHLDGIDADNIRIGGVGMKMDMYSNVDGDFLAAAALGTAGRLPLGGFTFLSDGTLELSMYSLPGFINAAGVGAGEATQFESRFNLTTSTGDGLAFLEVSGGTSAFQFNSDTFAMPAPNSIILGGLGGFDLAADVSLAYNMTPAQLADWLVFNDDPALANITNVIPEPATMILFTLGAAGIAARLRRRK